MQTKELLLSWINGQSSDDVRGHTLVVRCMDFRHNSMFAGCYEIANAGPRYCDSIRSIETAFILKANIPLVMFWLSHNEVCGCGKVETNSNDKAAIDHYSDVKRQEELEQVFSNPKVTTIINSGKLIIVSATAMFNDSHNLGLRLNIEETNELLSKHNLPRLDAIFDYDLTITFKPMVDIIEMARHQGAEGMSPSINGQIESMQGVRTAG
ncbi:MAG: hypothetical protein IT292_09760 [Deltaproteobacteria bacterium]|nr:hypothetical protein [Deltaproteobacteria bacterium]